MYPRTSAAMASFALALVAPAGVLAQADATMVREINPAGDGATSLGVTLADQLLFAGNGPTGSELWSTNGSADGTFLVRDINPAGSSNPTGFASFRDRVYFAAADGQNGVELWATDGTFSGTVLVKDINPAPGVSSSPGNFRVVGSPPYLYFTANGGPATGVELWRTDGTAAGTVLVADVNPGASGSTPSLLTAVGDTLFFRAVTIAAGLEVWRSDGVPGGAGTSIVADLNPGPSGSNPTGLAPLGSTALVFAANAGSTTNLGVELYTAPAAAGAGATLLKDISPGPGSSNPSSLTAFHGVVCFAATDGAGPDAHGHELWTTDGTPAGTALVTDLTRGPAGSTPVQFTVIADRLYFSASDPDHGPEPRRFDPDSGAVSLLADIRAGPTGSSLTSFGDGNPWIVLTAADGTSGAEPYRSDGTPEGTTRIADIHPGPGSSNPSNWRIVANRLVFLATDGTRGVEIWTTAVPDSFGACCALDHACTLTTLAACDEVPGGFIRGTACLPDPCPTDSPVACCYRDGTCLLTTRRQCFGTGSVPGTSCAAASCPPPPVGACCAGTRCSVLPWNQCSQVVYQGDDSTCSPDPANPTTCCRANVDAMHGVDVGDLFGFLALWFARLPAADFNESGGPVNVADIFAYLGAWFAGC